MSNSGLIPRDPKAEVRTRQTLDALRNVLNGLIRSGDIVYVPPGTWRLRPDLQNLVGNTPFLSETELPDELIIPGPPGIAGLQGPQGLVGPPGMPEEGPPGQDGNPGPAGAVGAIGPTGQAGATGQAIFVLEDGPPGDPGNPGATGPVGATGPTGATGAQGPIGPATYLFEDGPQGEQGFQGQAGVAGAAGVTGSQGPIGPATYLFEDPVPGDDGYSIVGPRGTTGSQGPIGPATYIFDDPIPGDDGVRGQTGLTGATGAQGPAGPAILFLEDPSSDAVILGGGLAAAVTITTSSGIKVNAGTSSSVGPYSLSLDDITPTSCRAITTDSINGAGAFTLNGGSTNSSDAVLFINKRTGSTPSNGFGLDIYYQLDSSTNSLRVAASDEVNWVSATDASRKAQRNYYVYDTSIRLMMRFEATGSAGALAFFGAGAVVQQSGDIGTALVNYGLMSGTPTVALVSAAAGLRGHIDGFALSTSAASTTLSYAVGTCRDDTDAFTLSLAAGTKLIANTWAAGSGSNGLDTGTVAASTWYHVFVISKAAAASPDILFSLSATAPTMPSTYTLKRRIGAILTDGSKNVTQFQQDGDRFNWLVAVADIAATNPGTSAVLRTLTVPSGVNVWCVIGVGTYDNGIANAEANVILITDPDITDTAPGFSAFNFMSFSPTANSDGGTQLHIRTNTSAQVRSRVSTSTANTKFYIVTHGWIDPRGKNG